MLLEEYEDSKPYFNFINSLKSTVTKTIYRNNLIQFVKYCQLDNAASLVSSLSTEEISNKIATYFVARKHVSKSTQMTAFAAIKHFCEMNDIILNWKKIRKFALNSQVPRNVDRAYEHPEIKRLIDYSDHRVGAIFLFLASTGIRAGALRHIRLEHLEDMGNVYKLTVYPGEDEEYFTFTTPECKHAIDSYLEFRIRNGESISPTSYLFVQQYNKFKRIRAKPYSTHSIENLLQSWLVNSGIRTWDPVNRFKRKQVPRLHGFRKFFTTQLANARVSPEIREMLLGHRIGLASAYYRPTEQDMLDEYMKAVDNLTIEPSMRLQRKVERLEIERDSFEVLRTQIEALEKKIG
jgi:integrase